MPLYEYLCSNCGHRFDVRQGINDPSLTVCPNCEGPIRRVIQPVGIVFKGSGFYKNDSRSSSEASLPAGERKTDAAPAAESKPAAESSTAPTPAAPSESSTSKSTSGEPAASS